jgi:hypothetical protein
VAGLSIRKTRLALSFGVEQDGDFAVVLDGDREVGGLVVVEVAGSDAVAALVVDGFLDLDAGAERPIAVATAILRIRLKTTSRESH